ncbi:hypothetical protein QEN19_000709 [Hanseniaspora menglaensis]
MSATTVSSILNLTKTIIGSGMLAVPFAFKQDGVFIGIILTLLSFVMTCLGLYYFIIVSDFIRVVKKNDKHQSSFDSICKFAFGSKDYKKYTLIFNFPMFLQCFGVCLSYLVLIGDIFHTLIPRFESYVYILLSTVIIVPLCFLPRLDNLKYSSMLGLAFICYISLFIILEIFIDSSLPIWNQNTVKYGINWLKISSAKECLSSFSILVFAFTASMNILPIYNELQDRSVKNMRKVIVVSVGLSCLLFISLGMIGYLSFGKYSDIKGNILLNYSKKFVTNSCLSFIVLVSFPLMFYPLRLCSDSIVDWVVLFKNRSASELEIEPLLESDEVTQLISDKRFKIITIVQLLSIYGLSLLIHDFTLVLALVGGIAATSISFFLPGFITFKILTMEKYAVEIKKYTSKLSLILFTCKVLMVFGISVMILSVYSTLTK